jgi:predicted ATPase/DNA-binding NarL/FixJ family response regulator
MNRVISTIPQHVPSGRRNRPLARLVAATLQSPADRLPDRSRSSSIPPQVGKYPIRELAVAAWHGVSYGRRVGSTNQARREYLERRWIELRPDRGVAEELVAIFPLGVGEGRVMKVLIAEDSEIERQVLREAVEGLGHDCLAAGNGGQAWELFEWQGADVVVSDWLMPDVTGPELCRRVRARVGAPYTYIILLTMLDDHEHARFGIKAGADAYLRKPLSVQELEVRLLAAARLLEEHRHLSRRDAQQTQALERRKAALRLARHLVAESDLEQLLADLVAESVAVLGGTAGAISLWDHKRGELAAAQNTIPGGDWPGLPERGQAPSPGAVLAAPLVHSDRLLGTLTVVSHTSGKQFTPDDADVLQQLAGIGAAALVGLDRTQRHGPLLPGSLPAQPTLLLGREQELDQLGALLGDSDIRLVTLTGPAGVGKTRLAVAAASTAAAAQQRRAYFVDLAPVTDPAMVVPAIAEALGLSGDPGLDLLHVVIEDQAPLVVLDNFEHLLPAARAVGELLAACPRLSAVVTSRAPLRLRWEHAFPVSPLALPEPSGSPDRASVAQSPAVALFVQRACAARPDFALTDENAGTIAEICARLDGLPLGIELAAERSAVLSPDAVLRRVPHDLGFLTSCGRDVPRRQQTLRDAIAWSYALLDPEDQRLFRSLAVFAGGFTPAAAESVAEVDPGPGRRSRTELLDALERLVDTSLLVRDTHPPAEPRFRMLRTLRGYAREQLESRRELPAGRRRHAAYFLALAERAEGELIGPNQAQWLERLDREHENLRRALQTVAACGDLDLELRLSGALARFWDLRGYADEGQEWLDRALSVSQAAPTAIRAKVLAGAARFAAVRGDWALAGEATEASLSGWRELDDRLRVAEALAQLAVVRQRAGRRRAALALAREGAALARELDSRWALARALHALGEIALGQGNYVGARKHFRDGLVAAHAAGVASEVAVALEGLAAVAAARGQPEPALRAAGGAAHVRDTLCVPLYPGQRELIDSRLASTRAALDEAQWDAAWAQGHALPLEQLVADALQPETLEPAPSLADDMPEELLWLTRRERQVARLVAHGLHNHEIGQRLYIASHTVEVHMTNILGKLGMASRAQLAVWAVQHGLLGARG